MANTQISKIIVDVRRAILAGGEADLSDGQLLDCFVTDGEEAAVAALVRRHGAMVWAVCRRMLSNHHDAEDAFQATFLVLVRKAASIRPRDMVANWLYGVARQTAFKARTLAAKRQRREKQMNELPQPEVRAEESPLQPILDDALGRLPDKFRVAIVLCGLEGKTRKEAARQLDIPEGTLSSRLTTARTLLARQLARHGFVVSGVAVAELLSQMAAEASVPPAVASSTIKAATILAAGKAVATGSIPANVAALSDGVERAMLLNKMKNIGVLVLLLIVTIGGGVGVLHGLTADEPAPAKAVARPAVKAVSGQPTAAEICEALRMSWWYFDLPGDVAMLDFGKMDRDSFESIERIELIEADRGLLKIACQRDPHATELYYTILTRSGRTYRGWTELPWHSPTTYAKAVKNGDYFELQTFKKPREKDWRGALVLKITRREQEPSKK